MLDRLCYDFSMVKESRKKKHPADLNLLAASIVNAATDNQPVVNTSGKNPHAVALGRLGGEKGGRARTKKLTPEQRSEIARIAANARWKKVNS